MCWGYQFQNAEGVPKKQKDKKKSKPGSAINNNFLTYQLDTYIDLILFLSLFIRTRYKIRAAYLGEMPPNIKNFPAALLPFKPDNYHVSYFHNTLYYAAVAKVEQHIDTSFPICYIPHQITKPL